METIKIKGMSCQHCVRAVQKALEEIDGVSGVAINLEKGEATFEKSPAVDDQVIKEKITKAGYELG